MKLFCQRKDVLALRRRALGLGLTASIAALAPLDGQAAAQDNDGLYWLERRAAITVSATRSPVDVIDAPATVTVLTDEDIADILATDVKDLVRFEPGISVRRAPARFGAAFGSTGRAGNEDFNIRGIGGNRVLIQIDGIRAPQGFSFGAQEVGRGGFADVGLVRSVEILRGPGSALYGSDGLSGVVSFVTSDPDDLLAKGQSIGGFARALYSGADNEFAETVALAARSGAWSAMLAYTRRDFEELENRGTVGGIGEVRTRPNPQDGRSNAVLAKLIWEEGGHRLRLTGEWLDSLVRTDVLTGEGPAFVFGPNPAWIVDNLDARDTLERQRVSLDWTWEGAGLVDQAKLALYWQDSADVQFTREDRSPVGPFPVPDRERRNTFENRIIGVMAEARSDFVTGALAHRLTYGLDINWTRQSGLRDGTVPPRGEVFPIRAFPVTDFMLGGLFIGDDISIGDGALTFYPALRFDFYDLDPTDDPLLPGFAAAGQDGSRLSPKLGVVAKLGGPFRLFGNYAQGFRAPTPAQVNNFFQNPGLGYTSVPNPDLRPERSESWEGGVRVAGKRVQLSLTAFRADYRDFIDQQVVGGAFIPSNPAVFQFINLGRVRVSGFEAKGDFILREGLTGRFALAYAKGDERRTGGARLPLQTVDPLTLVGGLGYRDPRGRFGGELIVTHNSRKTLSRTEGVCTGPCFRPGASTVIDLTAFWRLADPLTLRLGIFNLTDETYALWSDVRGLAASSTITDAFTRPGRNASLSATYRF